MSINSETIKLINSFAPWLSALGTIAAVITSLYLARREGKIKISVFASKMLGITPGQTTEEIPEFVIISATNLHRRPATLNKLYYRVGYFKKKHYVLPPMPHPEATIPKKLLDGDEVTFPFPIETFEQNFEEIAKTYLNGWFLCLKSYSIKAGFITTTGQKFESRVRPELRKAFLEHAKEIAKQPNDSGDEQ